MRAGLITAAVILIGGVVAFGAMPSDAGSGTVTNSTAVKQTVPAAAPEVPPAAPAGGSVSDRQFNVWAEDMFTSAAVVPSGSAPAAGPVCSYQSWAATGEDPDGGSERIQFSYRSAKTKEPVDGPGPEVEEFMRVVCPGQPPGYRWVLAGEAVNVDAVIRMARDRAEGSLPLPAPAMSPDPAFGAPAQLGLWLAVADPGQLNVVAQAGTVWAAITAVYTGTTWEMGNGDVVACEGLGTPYPVGANLVEEGPCGYTYRLPSDIGVQTMTVAGQWSLRLTTSTGRDELLEPVAVTTTFGYEVYEIVTVGGPA